MNYPIKTPSTVLVTGDRGFIGTYIVEKLIKDGHNVIGVDNNSKYGTQVKAYDASPQYIHYENFDVRDEPALYSIMNYHQVDRVIFGAALIGGIPYFHRYPYTLLATNEQIMASQFSAAIRAYQVYGLEKVLVISSSMVYENAWGLPSYEGDELNCPPPTSSYGFQKLACEYFARAAWDEFGLAYTIVRPFNCVGIGEKRAIGDHEEVSGNVKLAMSHVVPDLIQKCAKGQNPLHILGDGSQVRHYTYGADLADGIVTALFHPSAILEDFNLSSPVSTTVLELAEKVWDRFHPNEQFHYVSDDPYPHDVKMRVPDVSKAREILGWEATTTLDEMLDIVIPWVVTAIKKGEI